MREQPTGVPLDVSWSIDGPHLVVAVGGELDAANADALPHVITSALGADSSVRLDMSAVEFMDSSVLRALLQCQARLAVAGVDFKVRNVSPQARRIFEITSLATLIDE